jgi:predicted metal-dependent phosphoesterase TrpH
MYRIDLHVHTSRYSPCAETLNPEKLQSLMAQDDLNGIVITEHDHLWSKEEMSILNGTLKKGRIYRGVEVSSLNGHFLVIGLDTIDGISHGIGIEALSKIAQNKGAAVIWAHPIHNYSNIPDPLDVETIHKEIHAVEVVSGAIDLDATDRAFKYVRRTGCAAVGGSDAHVLGQVGCAYTLFSELPADEKALAVEIRAGRCRAMRRKDGDIRSGVSYAAGD